MAVNWVFFFFLLERANSFTQKSERMWNFDEIQNFWFRTWDIIKSGFGDERRYRTTKQRNNGPAGTFYSIDKNPPLGLVLLIELTTLNLHRPEIAKSKFIAFSYVTNMLFVICSKDSFNFIEEFVLLHWILLLLFLNCFAILLFPSILYHSTRFIAWNYFDFISSQWCKSLNQ